MPRDIEPRILTDSEIRFFNNLVPMNLLNSGNIENQQQFDINQYQQQQEAIREEYYNRIMQEGLVNIGTFVKTKPKISAKKPTVKKPPVKKSVFDVVDD